MTSGTATRSGGSERGHSLIGLQSNTPAPSTRTAHVNVYICIYTYIVTCRQFKCADANALFINARRELCTAGTWLRARHLCTSAVRYIVFPSLLRKIADLCIPSHLIMFQEEPQMYGGQRPIIQ
jgi:hypothetical protein